MYIARGEVTIRNSHFADNAVSDEGIDIWTSPSVIIINTTFSSHSNNSIHGTPHLCTPKICQHAIPSYPNYGIDCKNDVYKNDNYGVQCFPCHPGKYLPESDSSYASCLPCETGKATNKYGSASCQLCKAGTFAPTKGATFCVAAPKIINVYPNTNSKYKLNIEWSIPLHKTLSLNEMYVVIEPIDSITKQPDTNAIVIVQANLNKTTTGMLSFKIVDRVYQIHLRVQDKTNTTIGGIAKYSTPWQTTSSCRNTICI